MSEKNADTPRYNGNKKVSTEKSPPYTMVALVVVVIALIAVIITTPDEDSAGSGSFTAIPPRSFPRASVSGFVEPKVIKIPGETVARVIWTPEKPLSDYISQHPDLPIVFRNTIVDQWKARKLWTPEYLAQKLPQLTGIFHHRFNNSVFGPYWDKSKPMSSISTIQRKNPHKEVTMSGAQFIDKILHPDNNNVYYYSSNIQSIGAELAQDILPFDNFELEASERQNINVWIGQAGVIAALHYDGYDNVYAQLYGRKRWTLYPPEQARYLYVYPYLHPSHAQAQVDLNAVDKELYDQFPEATGAVQVVLEPGEVLYLPAMWFHHVEALDVSISVNAWSYTRQSEVVSEASREQPFYDSDPPMEKAAAVAYYVTLLLRGLGYPLTWVHDNVVVPRYAPLFAQHQLPSADQFGPFCRAAAVRTPRRVEDLAEYHALLFRGLPANTRELWLGNHLEYVAAMTTKNVEIVGAFLQSCFSMRRVSDN